MVFNGEKKNKKKFLLMIKSEVGFQLTQDFVCLGDIFPLAVKAFAFKVILKNVFRQVFNLIDFLKKLYYNNKGK